MRVEGHSTQSTDSTGHGQVDTTTTTANTSTATHTETSQSTTQTTAVHSTTVNNTTDTYSADDSTAILPGTGRSGQPDVQGRVLGEWEEQNIILDDRSDIVGGDAIPAPGGADGFDSVEEAAAWAAVKLPGSGADGAVILESNGRFYAAEVDVQTWIDPFTRDKLAGGVDYLRTSNSQVPGVRALVTSDGFLAPIPVAGNAVSAPEAPPVAAYADIMALRQAGHDLGLSPEQNVALFEGLVRSRAVEALDFNRARLDDAEQRLAAALPGGSNPDPELWDRLRQTIEVDRGLGEQARELEGELRGLRLQFSNLGTAMLTPWGQEQGNRILSRMDTIQTDLAAIEQTRALLRQDNPALAVLNVDRIDAEMSDTQVFAQVQEGLNQVRGSIADARERVLSGDMPLSELGPVIRQVQQDLNIDGANRAQGDSLSDDVLGHLEDEGFKENLITWCGTAVSIGLGVAAIVASGGWAVLFGLGGAAVGFGTGAYELERFDDLATAADAGEANGLQLLDDPDGVRFQRTMAVANLVLAGLDLGAAARAGSVLFRSRGVVQDLAESAAGDVIARMAPDQLLQLDEALRLRNAGDSEQAAALLARLRDDLGPEDFARLEEGLDGVRGRWYNQPTVTGDPNLPAGQGWTDKYGNVFYSTQGSQIDQDLVRHHEMVHSFLSPKLGPFRELRADLSMAVYNNSHFMRYLEEALAESYAQLRVHGISGLPEGIMFPIANGYVEVNRVLTEAAVGTITVGGVTYGVYQLSTEEAEQRTGSEPGSLSNDN